MSILRFQTKKQQTKKISMITCYDYPSALMVAKTAIDAVLVGDSVAMTVHGYPSTIYATIEMMVMHTAAVARGLGSQVLIADMPFMTHRRDFSASVEYARLLLQAGAHAVKVEGADAFTLQQIQHLVDSGVPVMGHIGLQPQSVLVLGGYKVQGKEAKGAELLLRQAEQLQSCGCFAVVLECIPSPLTRQITQNLSIPTIGIGAGKDSDGQILVWHDVLALETKKPKFVKQYCQLSDDIVAALQCYHLEIEQHMFPEFEHSFE